jgi:hypothetical protein
LIIICMLCALVAYFFFPARFAELTSARPEIARLLGLAQPTHSPTPVPPLATATLAPPTATPLPTYTVTPVGSPTVPPTDTPRPRVTPTDAPTSTPVPVPPTPASIQVSTLITPTQAPLAEALMGATHLIAIDHNFVFGPDVSEVEFTWSWSGATGCEPLPEGYGFEVRIWPNRPDFGPLGVEDAANLQQRIFCDPQTGRRSVKLGFLQGTPAVQLQGAGSFAWDVALVQLSPHKPLYASPPRLFEISLVYPNPGRLDPHGEAGVVRCSSFVSWAEAQAFFLAAGPRDPHRLDPDRNGLACDAIAPCLLTQPVEVCRNRFK